MCGIAGIFAYDELSDSVDQPELIRIRDYMTTRGPDGFGEWYSSDKRVGLAHRRLSIIDLSENASQPMKSVDGGLTVTFNGEICNYRALRAGLEACGCVFRTNSDTEVLLQLYRMRRPAMVGDLRGMFAFGLWANQRRRLLLARDPHGIGERGNRHVRKYYDRTGLAGHSIELLRATAAERAKKSHQSRKGGRSAA